MYWVTSPCCNNERFSRPDIVFWTNPISWICLFHRKWARGRVFKRSVIHHCLLNFGLTHPPKISKISTEKFLKPFNFGKCSISSTGNKFERRNDFKITFKYENRINDSPKWSESEKSFQKHATSKVWTRKDFPTFNDLNEYHRFLRNNAQPMTQSYRISYRL